ncbi:cellulose synthase subunit BcsC [Marinobacter litoralis]|uniref:Cellulose synthase subunit BcsC n=1 Tax=Marinobacter litoralis TaxID=187981 RepID=A0A3M2RLJ5_9GAMM|nr:tetratricopeptide repeat protein [Marinobacter litoralis]RMJ06148.1 cellulose synthase subunit BcsC [Marinobacter litoralis]
MNMNNIVRASLLSVAIASIGLAGCSNEPDMSQDDIQYISHVDQARFFQRQGELKASTIEARSAIQLQPDRPAPYFVIIDNLLTAGDAANAERQVDKLVDEIGADQLTQADKNKAALIRAKARALSGKTEGALEALKQLKSPSPDQSLEADNLKGQAWLISGDLEKAEQAYQQAISNHTNNALGHIGLSRVAAARENFESAKTHLGHAEGIDPEHEEVWLWKAQLSHIQGNWAAAEQAYIRALETIGQYDVMTFQKYQTISALVTVLRQQGKSAEAFVYEEILAKSAPGTIKSNLEAATAAYTDGDFDTAGRYLQEVLNQAPGHEQSTLMLGVVRFRQGRAEEAEKLLEPLAKMEDADGVRKLLAATRISMRDPQGAQSILDNIDNKDSDPQTLALVGIAALASGDDQTGRPLLEKSLELDPNNHNLRIRYAAYLTQMNEYEPALKQVREVPKEADEALQAQLLTARIQTLSGDADSARKTLDNWLADNPESIRALLARGHLANSLEQFSEADKYYKTAQNKAPENPAPLVALGNLAKSSGNTEQAIEFYKKAITLDPNHAAAIQAAAVTMGRDKLTAFMQKINETNPKAAGPRLVMLESALINNEATQADELTAQLMEREQEDLPSPNEPMVATVYEGIATQMAQRGNFERALEILNRGRILFPESESISLKLAAVEFQQGNTSEARDALQDVKQRHPDSPAPYQVEANFYENTGKHQQAAELYELAIEKRQTPELEVAHARALARSGQAQKALESLEAASQQFPNNQPILLSLAMTHQQLNQPEKAIARYQSLMDINPDNPLVLNNLAWLYYEKGDRQAANLAQKAYKLAPNNAAIADTYGWILFETGRQPESLPVLEKAHELDPESQEIAMHLVEAYRSAGKTDQAKQIMAKFEETSKG